MGMVCRYEPRAICRAEVSMCESIFPRFTKMLEEEKYELAIRVMAWHQDLDQWYNLTDFVFVKIYNEWIKPCKKFYAGKGPAVIDTPFVTADMISKWDTELCVCLKLAFDYAWERTTKSWWTFRHDFLEMVGRTP